MSFEYFPSEQEIEIEEKGHSSSRTIGYANGYRYCSYCAQWFKGDPKPVRCPDCNRTLRIKKADNHDREKRTMRRIQYGMAR